MSAPRPDGAADATGGGDPGAGLAAAGITGAAFTLLGTGTSAGVPVIACDCDTCTSADPRDRRTRTGAMLHFTDATGQERVLLVDAPPDHREHALRHRIRRVDGILFTHAHVDHVFGLDDARLYNVSMRGPVHLHAERTVFDELTRIYEHIFKPHRNLNKSFVATVTQHMVEAGVRFDLFGVAVTPIRLLHGALPILGYRFDIRGAGAPFPLAYCTDVNAIPPESWQHLAGVDTLVLDMLRERRHPTHFSLAESLEVAARVGARHTVFTHMTHDARHAELNDRLPAGVELGYDGMRLQAPAAG